MTKDIRKLQKALEQAKAEIEKLQTELYLAKYTDVAKKNIKAEAIKEFAERCKECFPSIAGAFDCFAKEMVGDSNV